MADLSSSGTWTALKSNLAKVEDVAKAGPLATFLHPDDLGAPPDEIRQMIRLAQDGWGALLGTNRRLDFWTTAKMVQLMLQAYTQPGAPRSGN